jgi:ABC-type polysaccharide/polyol phosphate export permease
VTIIGITRWAFAGGPTVPMFPMIVSGTVALLSLVLGYRFFRRREASFSDVI